MRTPFTDPYYCPERHMPRLEKCMTFAEIGEIYMEVAREIAEKHPDAYTEQVCGPISTGPGTVHEKLLRLERAVAYRRSQGIVVINQLPTEIAIEKLWKEWKKRHLADEYCWELLHHIYLPLFKSGLLKGLSFLPGWEMSIGTRWEHDRAERLSLKITYLPIDWE